MKTERTLCIFLLLLLNFLRVYASPQLDQFMKAVEDAHSELQWLDHVSADHIHPSKRSASIEELLARFEFADDDAELRDHEMEGGDAWYQSFRDMECRHGGCPKKPLRWKAKKAQPDDYYEYYEEGSESPKALDLKDQWEETQNDLSHEANYKLSKIEQDASEKNLPNTAWPIRHNPKRSVSPMQTVKLKTSLRMLQNGDGPSLPSSILSSNKDKISIEDILSDTKHQRGPDPWKESYEMVENRKLLSVPSDEADEEPVPDEKICGSKECLKDAMDGQQFDNLKQKSHLDRELEGLSFDNAPDGIDLHHEDKKGTLTSLSDELMHSAAFLKLQNFLKGKGVPKPNKTRSEARTSTTEKPTAAVPLNLVDKDRNVNIKLHMSVNATVLGNTKLPEQFHRNNTITYKPPPPGAPTAPAGKKKKPKKQHLLGLEEMDLDRDRRGIVFPLLASSNSKRRTNADISKQVIEATETFPLDELITGKLTSQLVKTVFALVRSSPCLKVLWPGLMRNKVSSPSEVKNFYAIRTHENESEMHRTELMLRQAMETINAIIEQQVRSRSCVPLRADLKAFYNLILATKAENDRCQDRQKRETEADQPPSMTGSQIRKKSRIVKKLLRDYEELPREDQDQVVNIKENLLIAAEELRELEQAAKRKKRDIMEYHFFEDENNTSIFQQRDLGTPLTPEYVKLAKTAEMFLHNSFKEPDLSVNFNYI